MRLLQCLNSLKYLLLTHSISATKRALVALYLTGRTETMQ